MNSADGARARRKAALLRAIAGLAARGPELGTNPFGSFQAGVAGALDAAAEQRAQADAERRQALQDQFMQAQIARMTGQRQEYGAMPWYENPTVDPALREKYRADALYHQQAAGQQASDWTVPSTTPEGDTERAIFPGLENLPPAGREIAFRQMMEQRFAPQRQERAPLAFEQEIAAIMAANPGMTRQDATNAYFFNRLNPVTGTTRVGPSFWDPSKMDTTVTTTHRSPFMRPAPQTGIDPRLFVRP